MPSGTPSWPAGTVTLAQLGVANGPADRVALPAGTRLGQVVDQDNNVTALLQAPAGTDLAAFLAEVLPTAGFEVTAATDRGLVFTGFGWNGAYSGGGQPALTLRRQSGS